MKSFKGRVPQLLRHPNGASVIDDAYNAAYPAQRNAMAAEFYGKEFTLFEVSYGVPLNVVQLLVFFSRGCFSCQWRSELDWVFAEGKKSVNWDWLTHGTSGSSSLTCQSFEPREPDVMERLLRARGVCRRR